MQNCHACNGELSPTRVNREFEIKGKICVVEDILALQCSKCGEVIIGKEGNKYIDRMVLLFEQDGYCNHSKEIMSEKGLTYEKVGNQLGVTKQSVAQMFKTNKHIYEVNLFHVSNILKESPDVIYEYRPIIEKEGKYYLGERLKLQYLQDNN